MIKVKSKHRKAHLITYPPRTPKDSFQEAVTGWKEGKERNCTHGWVVAQALTRQAMAETQCPERAGYAQWAMAGNKSR